MNVQIINEISNLFVRNIDRHSFVDQAVAAGHKADSAVVYWNVLKSGASLTLQSAVTTARRQMLGSFSY